MYLYTEYVPLSLQGLPGAEAMPYINWETFMASAVVLSLPMHVTSYWGETTQGHGA